MYHWTQKHVNDSQSTSWNLHIPWTATCSGRISYMQRRTSCIMDLWVLIYRAESYKTTCASWCLFSPYQQNNSSFKWVPGARLYFCEVNLLTKWTRRGNPWLRRRSDHTSTVEPSPIRIPLAWLRICISEQCVLDPHLKHGTPYVSNLLRTILTHLSCHASGRPIQGPIRLAVGKIFYILCR